MGDWFDDKTHSAVADVVTDLARHHVPDACAQCMPSSRTGNAVLHKLLSDLRAGIELADQPFVFEQGQPAPAHRHKVAPWPAPPEE